MVCSSPVLCLAGIFGFSARFTGGGRRANVFAGGSLRNSADLLGGGGSGGFEDAEGGNKGDLRWSTSGVWGLLGILKWRGDEIPGLEDILGASALKKSDALDIVRLRFRGFGGDCGGSIVTEGDSCAAGLSPMPSLWRTPSVAIVESPPRPS